MANGAGVTVEAGVGKRTSTDTFNGDSFGTLCARREGFLRRVEGGVEERINQG